MGDTTLATQRLPARSTAFERWPQDDPYTEFLDEELNRAIMRPVILNSNVGSILQGSLQSLFATDSPQVQQISDTAVSNINGN